MANFLGNKFVSGYPNSYKNKNNSSGVHHAYQINLYVKMEIGANIYINPATRPAEKRLLQSKQYLYQKREIYIFIFIARIRTATNTFRHHIEEY